MDLVTMTKIGLWVAAFVVTGLFGIVIYFARRWMTQVDARDVHFHEVLDKQILVLSKLEANADSNSKTCTFKHELLKDESKRYNEHFKQLFNNQDVHSKDIAFIKALIDRRK